MAAIVCVPAVVRDEVDGVTRRDEILVFVHEACMAY